MSLSPAGGLTPSRTRQGRFPSGALLVLAALLGAGLLTVTPPATAGLKDDLARARDQYAAGRFDDARAAYRDIVDRHGNDNNARDAWYYLALLSRGGADYFEALEAFLERGGRRDRRAAEVLLRLGRGYFTLGNYREALTRFETAREATRDPELIREARLGLGWTLLAIREYGEARQQFEAVAADREAGPRREAALYALAELTRLSGNHQAAARAYEECRRQYPNGAWTGAAYFGEAATRELLGETRSARALYAQLVKEHGASGYGQRAAQRLRELEGIRDEPRPQASGGGADEGERPAAAAGEWQIQVGAFAENENALKLAEDLTERGYPLVRVEKGDRDDLYHVRFGGYVDRAQAEQVGEKVAGELGVRYTLVPPSSERR